MPITYPLALPASSGVIKGISIKASSVVGVSESPFTFEQQVYENQGQIWSAEVTLKPMQRAAAEAWIAWLLSLNGRQGTFLMGDPLGKTARGVATGVPLVNGATQTGKSLITDGWTAGVTGILKAGDWIQLGTGSAAHLHKNLTDVNADGSGNATLDIYPRLRSSPADNAPLVVASAQGLWRLASNDMDWTVELAQIYGISFQCREAL